ncbi:MAG TPA: hypothetical protein VGO62_00540, partial [Myxococcota bacterium]
TIEHDDRPWRVFTVDRKSEQVPEVLAAGRFGALPSTTSSSSSSTTPGAPLGTAIALSGSVVDRVIALKETSAVRVRATSGVCALATTAAPAHTGTGGSGSKRHPRKAASTPDASGWRIVDAEGLGGGCDIVRVLPAGSHRVVVRAFGTTALSGNVSVSAELVADLSEGVGAESVVAAGDARTFRFVLAGDGEVGIGLQSDADTLDCALLDANQAPVGDGCHQFHRLAAGTYYLKITAPEDEPPKRFKPVLFGLKGDVAEVPDSWLRDFFARVPHDTVSQKPEVKR